LVPRSSRGETRSGIFTQEKSQGALTEFSVFVTSRVYFSTAQLYGHLHGDGVHVFRDVYVSRLLREAHIFISLLKEEREKEKKSEEDKTQALRGGSPMTEIRQKKISCGLA